MIALENKFKTPRKKTPQELIIEELNKKYDTYEVIYILLWHFIETDDLYMYNYIDSTISDRGRKELEKIYIDKERSSILSDIGKNLDKELNKFVNEE